MKILIINGFDTDLKYPGFRKYLVKMKAYLRALSVTAILLEEKI